MSDVISKQVLLTGIKPTGAPHIGNYLGSVLPSLELACQSNNEAFYFIADYHALTSQVSADCMLRNTYEIAAFWLAFGLDPNQVVFYRQSDVPEVFELSWILACFTPKGFMNKAHAYKAAADRNREVGEPEDAGVGMGLYTYPVLMAAGILVVDADLVPVGKDQVQHVEIARDIAMKINYQYGEGTLYLPKAVVREQTAIVPGLDGRKMSKSYGNTIPCFLPSKKLRKTVMSIKTSTTPPNELAFVEQNLVFQIHKALINPERHEALLDEYRESNSWGAMKEHLYEELEALLAEPRERYEALIAQPKYFDEILFEGAKRVRSRTKLVLERVRSTIGITR